MLQNFVVNTKQIVSGIDDQKRNTKEQAQAHA